MAEYICQLPNEKQDFIRRYLEDYFISEYGSVEDVKKCCGMTLEEVVQRGMDSKITDLDYLLTDNVSDNNEETEEWER